jgi:hypothetical protein
MEKDYHNHIKGVHSTDLYMDKDSYNPLKEYRPTHGQILLYSYKGSIGLHMDEYCYTPIKGV